MRMKREPWLPDLCRFRRLLAVLVAAEVVVVAVLLMSPSQSRMDPEAFAATSAFGLWAALLSCMVLCGLRSAVSSMPRVLGAFVAIAIPMALTGGMALAIRELGSVGFLPPQFPREGFDRSLGLTLLAGVFSACFLRYFYVTDRWVDQVRASAQASFEALQARIRPHFLFNSLNSIASLIRTDPVRAELAIENLSDLFRAVLTAGDSETSLREELDLSRRYLELESLRYGDRLKIDWDVDVSAPLDMRIPPLLIQPLLENAVNHGISRLPAGGAIEFRARREGGVLVVVVSNPTLPSSENVTNGHALMSISRRLGLYFRSRAGIEFDVNRTQFKCTLRLPIGGQVGSPDLKD